jgi:tight adherence protein C
MIFLGALCGAVLTYCLFVLCLDFLFAKKIGLRKRLKEISELNRADLYEAPPGASFSERIVKPFVYRLVEMFTIFIPRNTASQERLSQQLKQAGMRVDARTYRASVLLFTVICVLLGVGCGILMRAKALSVFLFGILGLYAGVVLSRFSLRSKITRRKNEMYHQLPEMLDLLSVSVSAGLGFDQALAYVVRKSEGALFQELDVAQREIALGRPRKEALLGLAERCDNLEMRTFVSAVLQADEMGSSMQNILQVQADTIRQSHKQQVEEKAQKLSIKMLFPLIFCIFPVMLIVLMGPAVLSILKAFGSGM